MTQSRYVIVMIIWICWPAAAAEAQHHHHHIHSFNVFGNPYYFYQSNIGYPSWTPATPTVTYANPVYYVPAVSMIPVDPTKAPPIPSSPIEREKSLEHQRKGEKRLKQQSWSDARVAFSSAVKAAPDRAEAHLRLGLCYFAIQRFDSAVREIKRAVFLEPTITVTGGTLETIFGSDNRIALTSMISKLGDWVREDIGNSDRLFLLGAILYFNSDQRANDAFEAAIRMQKKTADKSHIIAFMQTPLPPSPDGPHAFADGVPELKAQPSAIGRIADDVDLRFPKSPGRIPAPAGATGITPIPGAPVPMP